jgi:hypothetical protein
MKKKPRNYIRNLRITSSPFKSGENKDLHCIMRLEYNVNDGIQLLISKEKNIWHFHSTPYPGEVPAKELDDFIALFKRGIKQYNPKATFKKEIIKIPL